MKNKSLSRTVKQKNMDTKPLSDIPITAYESPKPIQSNESVIDRMIKHFGVTKRLTWLKEMENKEKDKASQMLEDLKAYFENTPREQVLADWEKSKKYDRVGPTVKDFIEMSKRFNNSSFSNVLSQIELVSRKGESTLHLDFYLDEQSYNNLISIGFDVKRTFIRNEELTTITWE